MEADFSGYATKAGLKCSDGRTITPEAFKHQDKVKVPLVWQHGHNDSDNVLGHVMLENREDGVYAYGFFNDTPKGVNAKKLVQHEDVNSLSIWANKLVERGGQVFHGIIREVSLVLSGANPGAKIDFIRVAHADGSIDDEPLADEAIIYTGLTLEHSATTLEAPTTVVRADEVSTEVVVPDDAVVEHAEGDDETVQDVYDTLSDKQKEVVNYMIGAAIEAAGNVGHSATTLTDDSTVQDIYDTLDDNQKVAVDFLIGQAVEAGEAAHANTEEGDLVHQEGTTMTNVFEAQGAGGATKERPVLSHDAMEAIVTDGNRLGTLSASFLEHAGEYGIDDIDFLFPDAKTLTSTPQYLSRRMEWVQNVLSGVSRSPFTRVKSIVADITADEARAKGYVKGNLKKDEVIKLLKRVTTPKTIYKKQKLDRDDILDIVDLDVVAWLKTEMRLLLDEEIAAAILVGDGREPDDEDKIDEDHLRPIAFDVDMYNTVVQRDSTPTAEELVDIIITASGAYKGSGNPSLYTTQNTMIQLLLIKDTTGRRIYNTMQELAGALLVKEIVIVEAMERAADITAVIVNLTDYTVGADKGGNVAMFEDFDIDYNQQKYLIETRISGALTRPKSAVTIKANLGTIVTPQVPTFVNATGVGTIPTQTGVVYKNKATGATLSSGAQTAVAAGASVEYQAVPAAGYSFPHGGDYDWTFKRDA